MEGPVQYKDIVSDWMHRNPVTIVAHKSVHEAAQLMAEKHIGSLLVTSEKKKGLFSKTNRELHGVVTEADIVTKVLSQNLDSQKIRIADIMSTTLITVPESAHMIEVSKLMEEHKIKRLPVLGQTVLVGIISITDVLFAMLRLGQLYNLEELVDDVFHKKLPAATSDQMLNDMMTVKNWMIHPVITIQKHASLLSAAQLFAQHKISALPVVVDNGYIVGIISSADMVRKVAAHNMDLNNTMVETIMTQDVITVSGEASINEIAELLNQKKFKHIPIVENFIVTGIIGMTDILTVMLKLSKLSQAQNLIEVFHQ